MNSIVQNGWDQRTVEYMTCIALTLLYYDYALTFDNEHRLFWSRRHVKQWGSVLFFANRYCGVIGHIPVIVEMIAQYGTGSSLLCNPLHLYHQILAVTTQTIIGLIFIAKTYALYGRSRVVLAGLTSLGLICVAVGGYMLSQGKKLSASPVLPEGSVSCVAALSWSQSWRLTVVWGCAMVFDLIVVLMTLVKSIQISRNCGGRQVALTHILMRDGVLYFGVIGLAMLSNILTFLFGSEITSGVATTMTNVLACVLASRLMFNLRAAGLAQTSTAVLPSTLTNIEDIVSFSCTTYDRTRNRSDPPPVKNIQIASDDKRGSRLVGV